MQEYHQQKGQKGISDVDLIAQQVTELINAVLGQEVPTNRHSSETETPPVNGNWCSKFYIGRNLGDERRTESISRWLASVCQNEVDNKVSATEPYKRIFDELSCWRLNKAIDLAIEAGLYRLATIIPQVNTIDSVLDLNQQITLWYDSGVLNFADEGPDKKKLFHPDLCNIYALMSGSAAVEVKNIGWLRALGLLFWYQSPCEWSIMDRASQRSSDRFKITLKLYEDLLKEDQVDPPSSKWENDSDHLSSKLRYDGIFYLFKLLICNPNEPCGNLVEVLGNEGYTRDPLDYRISYLLLILLSSSKVGNISISSSAAAVIMQHLIHQLLSMEMVKEAIFISMQIAEDFKRKIVVKEIINRSIYYNGDSVSYSSPSALFDSIDDWLEGSTVWQHVINRLAVPAEWVYEGLAYSFRNLLEKNFDVQPKPLVSAREKNIAREVYCLQKAGLHDAAISVLNNQLCMWYLHPYQKSEAVSEQYALMSHLLRDYKSSSGIVFKALEDRFFVDYFYIVKKKYDGEEPSNDEVMKLYENIYTSNPRLSSVPSEAIIDSLIDYTDSSSVLSLTSIVRCTMGEVLLKINSASTSSSYRNIITKYHLERDSDSTKHLRDNTDFNMKLLLDVELAAALRRACDRT